MPEEFYRAEPRSLDEDERWYDQQDGGDFGGVVPSQEELTKRGLDGAPDQVDPDAGIGNVIPLRRMEDSIGGLAVAGKPESTAVVVETDDDTPAQGTSWREHQNRMTDHEILPPRQVTELAKRIERGDLEAKEKLITHNIRLVMSVARRYAGSRMEHEDLVQEGTLGLIRAAEKFDYRKGFTFSTYATFWIRQAMQRATENKELPIRLPVHISKLGRKVERAKDEYRQNNQGRDPRLEEISAITGVEEKELMVIERARQKIASLDRQIGDDNDGGVLGEFVASSDPEPSEILISTETKEAIAEVLARMDPFYAEVLRLKFGLDGDDEHESKADIARAMKVPSRRVDALVVDALEAFEKELSDEHDDLMELVA